MAGKGLRPRTTPTSALGRMRTFDCGSYDSRRHLDASALLVISPMAITFLWESQFHEVQFRSPKVSGAGGPFGKETRSKLSLDHSTIGLIQMVACGAHFGQDKDT